MISSFVGRGPSENKKEIGSKTTFHNEDFNHLKSLDAECVTREQSLKNDDTFSIFKNTKSNIG
jgi:hypothetical protein